MCLNTTQQPLTARYPLAAAPHTFTISYLTSGHLEECKRKVPLNPREGEVGGGGVQAAGTPAGDLPVLIVC